MPGPENGDYPEYYGKKYIKLVPSGDILDLLEQQLHDLVALLTTIGEEKGAYRYGPGKWSIKEVIGHLVDEERLFGYQAFRISRQDTSRLAGLDEDPYVTMGRFNSRSLASIAAEFEHLRRANLELFKGMDATMLARRGTADGHDLAVRAIPWVMTGHVIHHLNVIKDRYL